MRGQSRSDVSFASCSVLTGQYVVNIGCLKTPEIETVVLHGFVGNELELRAIQRRLMELARSQATAKMIADSLSTEVYRLVESQSWSLAAASHRARIRDRLGASTTSCDGTVFVPS